MKTHSEMDNSSLEEPVKDLELNSWRRGFTPQAEIWNGRMAIIGLVIGISVLVLINHSIVIK